MESYHSKYRDLWQSSLLYQEDFINKFGISSPHWTFESEQKRELSLRHDYCCALLSNLERSTQKRKISESSESIEKGKPHDVETSKRRKMESPPPDPFDESNTEDELIYDEIEDINIDSDDDETEWEPMKDEPEGEVDETYRYMLLEGNLYSAAIQNFYCNKFKIEKFSKTFDIVDTSEQKFIEVKITLNPEKRLMEFQQDSNTNCSTALITIHPETFSVEYTNLKKKMPGEDKVVNFLIKRSVVMKKLMISDSYITEEPLITNTIFSSDYINENLIKFEKMTERGLGFLVETDFPRNEEAELEIVDPKTLFELLDDPTDRDGPPVTWKGVLSPPIDVSYQSCSGTDLDNIKEFLNELASCSLNYISGREEHQLSLKEVLNEYVSDCANVNNFRFHKPTRGNKEKFELLKASLGIGKKKKVYNDSGINMIQEEYPILEKRRYDTWFEDVIENLGENHKFKDMGSNQLVIEKLDNLELGRELQEVLSTTLKTMGKKNLGLFASQNINLGSRISGTYLVGSSKKSSHSFISCIPLVANMYKLENNESFRVGSGICFRAPHHARNANDNINLFVVERICKTGERSNVKFQNECIVSGNMFNYRIRQTAIKKLEAVHLTFLYNSLFNAVNLMGELALNNKQMKNMSELTTFCKSMTTVKGASTYFLSRITESVMMAVIGNSRDEGYFSIARKLFMILLSWRRDEEVFTWNIKEFAEKLNECLVDNPLSMHFHLTFKYLISCYGLKREKHK